MPLRGAVSAAALRVIREAFEDLEKVVTPQDAKEFKNTTLQNVQKAALEIETRLAARQSLCNMRRLMPLFTGLEHYAKVMEVLCNGTPFLPWVWAPIKLVLTISSDYVDAFDKVIRHYARIAESLTRFEILGSAFQNNAEFCQVLAVFYTDILRFHKEAYKFVRRRSWNLFFTTSCGRFQRRFEDIIANLKAHEDLLDKTANAINIAEARQERADIEQRRKDQLEKLAKEEKAKASKQYWEIAAWLKADQSDQILISERIGEAASRHPGSCDWILKVDHMKSWMQERPENPFLWLQGNPGSGKSVLATQVINFLRSAPHCMLISHFCTYSYRSSTRYDFILRSLLLQIIQDNEDLIAYLHRLKETEFAKRPVTTQALEKLILILAGAVSDSPGETKFVRFVIDGVDECEEDKQGRIIGLLEHLVSKSGDSNSVVCKVIFFSRPSDFLRKRLRRKVTVSLTDEKVHVEKVIKLYACQRFTSLHQRLSEMGISDADNRDMAAIIAQKADGMFLWARLVLDYISKNMFFRRDEVMTAVQTLPRELSAFYRKILTQILSNFDPRSTDRLKSIFGWIAFAKRPLKKFELQSALAFSCGHVDVDEIAPSYLFGMCEPLIEERRDSTLSFIHVSVKDYLEDEDSGCMISEASAGYEQGLATITCLLSGLVTFSPRLSDYERELRVLKGLHAFHLYSSEYWLDHLLVVGTSNPGFSDSSKLYFLMSRLSIELDQLASSAAVSHRSLSVNIAVDSQLSCLKNLDGLYECGRLVLQARTAKTIDESTINEAHSGPVTDLRGILALYQATIRSILPRSSVPGASLEDLERFKQLHRTSAYTCRLGACDRATIGFETEKLWLEHEQRHVRRLYCEYPGCQYPPFPSNRALRSHVNKDHDDESRIKPTRSIRSHKSSNVRWLVADRVDPARTDTRSLDYLASSEVLIGCPTEKPTNGIPSSTQPEVIGAMEPLSRAAAIGDEAAVRLPIEEGVDIVSTADGHAALAEAAATAGEGKKDNKLSSVLPTLDENDETEEISLGSSGPSNLLRDAMAEQQVLARMNNVNIHQMQLALDSMEIPRQVIALFQGELPADVKKWVQFKQWFGRNNIPELTKAQLLRLQTTQFRQLLQTRSLMQASARQLPPGGEREPSSEHAMKMPNVSSHLLQITPVQIAELRQKFPQLAGASEDQIRRIIQRTVAKKMLGAQGAPTASLDHT